MSDAIEYLEGGNLTCVMKKCPSEAWAHFFYNNTNGQMLWNNFLENGDGLGLIYLQVHCSSPHV